MTIEPAPPRWPRDQSAAAGALRPGSAWTVLLPPGPRDETAGAGTALPGPAWTVPLRRPPQGARPPLPAPVLVPAPAAAGTLPSPLGLATIVTSLLAATVVALVLHQPAFLLLGAVGALGTGAVAGWQRWRQHRRRRAAAGLDRVALEQFGRDLRAHQHARADRLRADTVEVADAVDEVLTSGARRWTRRRSDADAFRAVVGRGDRLLPAALDGDTTALGPGGWAVVEATATMSDVPISVDVGPGAVVGVVGPDGLASSLARALIVQLAVAHGPADLLVAGLTATDDVADDGERSWLSWLPHAGETSGETGGETRIGPAASAADLLAGLATPPGDPSPPHVVLAVFDPAALVARNSPARHVLASAPSAAAVVVAPDAAQLPGICTVVVEVRRDAVALLHRPGGTELAQRVEMAGLSLRTAREVARRLAGLSDPERHDLDGAIPALVDGNDELGHAADEAEGLRALWRAAGGDPPLRTRLAMAADGPIEVDLVRDGPHALVAGTTGSGKSELLRSLIAGLAVAAGPDELQFVLIDYKGGAAFDACARLPHVAGLVTDLDEDLAERALRSLDAELRYRERVMRDAGAADLAALRAEPGHVRLPRLVVVVDEFATLAADLPGFVPSLVGVAQRGRSLGVHLILATQRPGGVVSEDIRANANLRIALRVQSATDSVDVLGDPIAASLPRRRPGRAVFRFGPGELVTAQVVSVSRPPAAPAPAAVTVEPTVPASGADQRHDTSGATGEPTLLARLVDAAGRAAGSRLDTHRPWLPPLPAEVWVDDLPLGSAGLLDDPDRQLQEPWTWTRGGHLLCAGAVGSGVAEALATLALATAAAHAPAGLHLHVVSDHPALVTLRGLPHVGAVIGTTDEERQGRFLRRVERWLDERAAGAGGTPAVPAAVPDVVPGVVPDVLIVADELGAWRQAVADRLGPDAADTLDRLLVEGPARGVVLLAGVDRPGPSRPPCPAGSASGSCSASATRPKRWLPASGRHRSRSSRRAGR